MNTEQSGDTGQPVPEQDNWPQTDNLGHLFVFVDAVADTTIRPIPSPAFIQVRPTSPPQQHKPQGPDAPRSPGGAQ